MEQSQRVTEILESITDGFIALDHAWRVTYANAEAERISGFSRVHMLDKSLWELFPGMSGTRIDVEFRRSVREQTASRFEYYYPASGQWFNVKCSPSIEGGLSVYFYDISAYKQGVAEARAGQEWLATTLESIGDAVIATDASGRVTLMNSVAEQLTGWTRTEAAGMPLDAVFVIVNEATRRRVENPVGRVLATGSVQGLAKHTLLISRDGTERPIDDSTAPIRTEQGLIGVVLVFRDFSARRRAEMALQASEERFRLLAEAMPQFVWVSDPEGRVEYVNSRWTEYTGQTLDETGRHRDDVIHPEDALIMWERWERAKAAGTDYEVEFRCRCAADGAYRWFLARGVPKLDAEGRIVRWIGTSTDIDAQKRAEAQVNLLNLRLHRAVTESSHRIKNQLQMLAATVDMALIDGPERIASEEFRRLGTQIRTLSALQDILTVEWKSDTTGSVDSISSRTLLERALDILRQATPGGRAHYTVADVPLTVKQATSLALIANEAVANAIKHGQEGVEVTFRNDGGTGVLEVCDDGPGFPPGFDAQVAANTGLELIASLVAFDLHGTVRYDNRPSGGARVTVLFPLSDLDAADEEGSQSRNNT